MPRLPFGRRVFLFSGHATCEKDIVSGFEFVGFDVGAASNEALGFDEFNPRFEREESTGMGFELAKQLVAVLDEVGEVDAVLFVAGVGVVIPLQVAQSSCGGGIVSAVG